MDILLKYFPRLTEQQKQRFEKLGELYLDWNEKINLISRKDTESLYEKHILHSLGIAKVIQFKDKTMILDVGTGGGFPGIPLAILFPEARFHLIDSIGKKIMVVNDIAEKLELTNVKAEQIRAEQAQDQYDFIVSRAVTRLKPFTQWIQGKFLKGGFNSLDNGILYLKGGDIEGELGEELAEVKRPKKIYELHEYFEEEFFETKKIVYVPMS